MTFALEWIISQEEGMTIKEFLKTKNISKTALTDIKFKGGSISINGTIQNVRYHLKNGDCLKLVFPKEVPSEGLKGESIPLHIVYEDKYLLVVEKEYGMNTIPSREHPTGSLANGIIGYYEQKGIHATTHIVTRLDRDTSGLVLIAKHRHIHHLLCEAQKRGEVNRKYIAFVEGNIEESTGTILAPIGRREDSIIQREVRTDGQEAITHYQVCSKHGLFSVVELKLETGRTHQIRVHMASIGHPLVGDDLYGGKREFFFRQALHCFYLQFTHPITGELVTLKNKLPQDMRSWLKNHGSI